MSREDGVEMKRRFLLWALVVGCAVGAAVPLATTASAGDTAVIRLAHLGPRGSSWDKIFRAWSNSAKKETNGAVKFRFYQGGVAGSERDVIRKMKAGQMDAAGLTSIGLGQIARPVTIMQMPGIFANYKQLNSVRETMAPEFEKLFNESGYSLMGWGDAGFARIFAKQPILKPSDYKKVRPWVPKADPVTPEMMKMVGANGVSLGIPEVLPALQTGMVDCVTASAVAAVALQWVRHTTHMSADANLAIVGATVIKKDVMDKLAPDVREKLFETGKKAHAALVKQVQKEDKRAYKTLIKRGMIEFDPLADPKVAKEWNTMNDELLKKFTGRLWSKDLYAKVKAAAAKVK